jgi:hypothetical protein
MSRQEMGTRGLLVRLLAVATAASACAVLARPAEASELIDRLVAGEDGAGGDGGGGRDGGGVGDTAASAAAEARLDAARAEALAGMPAEALAAELERRGWRVTAP